MGISCLPRIEKTKLSVLIHCYNNEGIIQGLLENVKWADEIVVCDSFSADRTVEICRLYTDKVYQYEHKNSADQKNWTIPRCSHEWILQVDTDERLSSELIEEIKTWIGRDIKYEAFRIPRKNYLFGKWMRGKNIYPDCQERLFRRHLRFKERHIHARLIVNGDVRVLKGHILHHGWDEVSIIKKRFNRQRKLCLLQKRSESRRYRGYHLILRPPAIFLYLFVVKKGFIDGWRGVFYCGFLMLLEFFVLKDMFFSKPWGKKG